MGKSRNKTNKDQTFIKELLEKDHFIELQKSELTEKQREIEESLDRFADLYDFAPNGYLTLNEQGIIKDINYTGIEMLESEKKSLKKLPFISFIPEEEISKFFVLFRKAKHENMRCGDDFSIITKTKKKFAVHILFAPVWDYQTKELLTRISLTDITSKKLMEDALKDSEQRFRIMAETAPVMIWMSDSENNLIYANATKLRFLGKSFDEVKAQKWLELIHPDDRNQYIEISSKALKSSTDFSIELRVKNRDNEYRWVLRNASTSILPDDSNPGFIGSEIDITESRNAKMLTEKSLKEKEVLLKEIHHRVKNNLQIISSLLNLQLNYVDNDEIVSTLLASQSRIRSMALIHEKLYKTKEFSNINFSEYARELVSFLFKTFRSKSNSLRLNMDLADINLNINLSVSLGLILNELITNTLKHAFPENRKGELKISLSKHKKFIELIVSDNGIGLPQDFNISNTKSLGLELVDTLVEQHKGTLEINRNGRTEFKITLPSEK